MLSTARPHVPQGEGRSEGLVQQVHRVLSRQPTYKLYHCSNTYPENGVLPTNFAEEPNEVRLNDITALVVEGDIQALHFLLFVYPQSNHDIQ